MNRLPVWIAFVSLFGFSHTSHAGLLAIHNATITPIDFSISYGNDKPTPYKLERGETRVIAVGKNPDVQYVAKGETVKFRLEPYSAYIFTNVENDQLLLYGVELANPMPKPDDVPNGAPAVRPVLEVAVKMLVDDADPRVKAAYTRALTERLATASGLLEAQCGVKLTPVEFAEWQSNPNANDLQTQFKDFEKFVKPLPGEVAVGYTSRARVVAAEPNVASLDIAGCTRGPLSTHILLREFQPRMESERVEVLVHELAHRFGAAHAPGPLSSMRPKLGDGLANNVNYRISLDPLNALAVAIWVDEIRLKRIKKWTDLSPLARQRLVVIYRTIRVAFPEDPVADEYLAVLERNENRARLEERVRELGRPMRRDDDDQRAGNIPPQIEELKRKDAVEEPAPASERAESVRKVLRGITLRATDLRRSQTKRSTDELTAELVRAAADVALTLDNAQQVPAFLLALGIGLDDSTILRNNLLARSITREAESEQERRERVAVLGVPTLRGRRDLCQHFFVSVALTELVGASAAEAAGLAKEFRDMQGTSGFSFADMTANLAGIAFAKQLQKNPKFLLKVRDEFQVEQSLPHIDSLREGLTTERFQNDFGSATDARFRQEIERIRKLVQDWPANPK